MDFSGIPSLANLSYAEIALAVFHNPDVYKLAFDHYQSSSAFPHGYIKRITMKNVLDVAVDKMSTLILAPSCLTKLRNLILNMIHELRLWKESLKKILDIKQLKNIRPFWTKRLTIDHRKSAKILVETTGFDVLACFRLSCEYFFYDDALSLYSNMTVAQRATDESVRGVWRLLYFWINTPEFEENQRDVVLFPTSFEPRELLFDEHVILHILLPAESRRGRERVLLKVATNTEFAFRSDFALWCFLQLDEELQEEVLKEQPLNVLECLLTWPFHSYFLDVAVRVCSSLSMRDFCYLLETFMFYLNSYEWQNFELAEILKQFWDESPANFKDYAEQLPVFDVLKLLLDSDSLETLDCNILQDARKQFNFNKYREFF